MKKSNKVRLVGLGIALVLLIALSIGGGVWYFNRGEEQELAPNFSDTTGIQRTGMIKEGEIY